MRTRNLAFASVAIAAMGIVSVATPAQAAAGRAQAAKVDRHCVTNVENASTTCYGSFTEAVAKATDGRVTDAPAQAQTAMNDRRLDAQLNASNTKKSGGVTTANRAAAADVVIGIEFDGSYRGGDSLTYTASRLCTGSVTDREFSVASMSSRWNDDIGSYRAYGNCWAKHFEHNNFGGNSTPFHSGQDDMGGMEDETSSIQWS